MAAAGLGALLLLAACDHKELCYQHPHTSSLHVVFDWREAPMRTRKACTYGSSPRRAENRCNITLPARRAEPSLAGRGPLRRTGPERRHGKRSGSPIRNGWTDSRSAQPPVRCWPPWAAAATNVPRAEGTEDQAVLLPPDMVYGACLRGSDGPPGNGSDHYALPERKGLPLHGRNRACEESRLRIPAQRHALRHGGRDAAGLGPAVGPACIVPFEVRKTDATTVRAEFLTFGHCPVPAIPHKIVIYGVLTRGTRNTGSTATRTTVTPQIHDAPTRAARIPSVSTDSEFDPAAGSSGMNPTIDDWGEVNRRYRHVIRSEI